MTEYNLHYILIYAPQLIIVSYDMQIDDDVNNDLKPFISFDERDKNRFKSNFSMFHQHKPK